MELRKSHQVARGALKDAFISKHPALKAIDKVLGWVLMMGFLVAELISCLLDVYSFRHGLTAYGVFNVAGRVSTTVIALLALLLWHSFCYYDPRVRTIMSTKTRFTPNGFMRSGYLPVPAAASVGLLLFVTAVFVSASIKPGSMLTKAGAGIFLPWLPGMTCRASAIENADYLTSWSGRIGRSAPIQGENEHFALMHPAERKQTQLEGACFYAPYEFGQGAVINADGTDKDIPDLVHPMGDSTRLCMYQCVLWQSFNVRTFLATSGSIAIGAGIVVVLTESLSSRFGLPVVTLDTSPEELMSLLHRTGRGSSARRLMAPFQTSMFLTAVPLVAINALLKNVVVAKINADGFFTVDFYVVFALLYSVVIVSIMRMWHFFECRPQIFTRKLWAEGSDNFVVDAQLVERWNTTYGEGQFVKIRDVGEHLCLVSIDLYQWMHLRGQERATLLMNHCRVPGRNDEAGLTLMTIAAVKVTLQHKIDYGCGEQVNAEKHITLQQGEELSLLSWKDESNIFVEAVIDGRKEKLFLNYQEVIERSDAWSKMCEQLRQEGLVSGSRLSHANLDYVRSEEEEADEKGT